MCERLHMLRVFLVIGDATVSCFHFSGRLGVGLVSEFTKIAVLSVPPSVFEF